MTRQTTAPSEFVRQCIRRAFRGKLLLAETAVTLLAIFAVPVGLYLFPGAGGAMNWFPLLAFVTVFIVTVLFGLMTAPYWMYKELETEKNDLANQLDTREARRRAIVRLWELRKVGVQLRGEAIGGKELADWLLREEEWRSSVFHEAATVSQGLKAWLEILDRVHQPPQYASQNVSEAHAQRRAWMSERLLRLEEFLRAEMLNKDIEHAEQ